MSGETPTLFVRRASGLVRTVGPFTAFMIVFSHTVGGGIHRLAVQASYNSPGAYVPYSFLVTGLLAAIPTALVYTMLGSMMPRTGGDYIFITRGLSPIMGFVSSWGFWFTEVLSYGIIAWYSIDFFAGALTISGVVLNNTGILDFAQFLYTQTGHWIVSAIFVFGFALLALFGMRVYSWVVNILGTLAIIGVISNLVILGGFGLASGASIAGWDRVFGTGAYEKIVQKSFELSSQYKTAFPVTTFTWSDTMRAGIGAIWAYIGITSAVYVGGEIKSPSRTLFISQVLGTLVIMIYYIGLPALVYSAWQVPESVLDKTGASQMLSQMGVPKDRVYFMALYQFLMNNWGANNVASLLGVPQAHLLPAGVVTTYTVTMLPAGLSWLQILNGVLVGIVLLKDIPAFFLVSSRMIFAWSFDRFFPEVFARVNSTFNSPHWAIILTMIGGFLGVALNIYTGEWLSSIDTTMLYQFAVMIAGLSAAVLPFIRSDIYEKSTAKYSIGGVPLLTIIGVICFASNFYFLIVAGTWLNMEKDLVLQTVWMGLGAALFAGYLTRNVKKGIDVKTIYTEIPPA